MRSGLMSLWRGRTAEQRACRYLKNHGYRVLERNVRVGGGEIDVVALRERTIVFVEVRYRMAGLAAAADSIDHDKRQTLLGAVRAYRHTEGLMSVLCRIDVLSVTNQPHWQFDHGIGVIDIDEF